MGTLPQMTPAGIKLTKKNKQNKQKPKPTQDRGAASPWTGHSLLQENKLKWTVSEICARGFPANFPSGVRARRPSPGCWV